MKAFLPILAISAFAFSGQVMADTQSDVATTLEQHFSAIKQGKLELLNQSWDTKVATITEISGSIAVAKVSINWKGAQYSDALTLSKGTEGWKIISKVYQAPKKARGSYVSED